MLPPPLTFRLQAIRNVNKFTLKLKVVFVVVVVVVVVLHRRPSKHQVVMRLHFCVFVQCPSTRALCTSGPFFLFFPRWTQVERSFQQCQTDCQFVDNFIYSDGTERRTHTSIALAELVVGGVKSRACPASPVSVPVSVLCILPISCLGC